MNTILPASISETIEGIFGDDLKSSFKPSTLVPVVIFLLFHLTFLFDPSISQDSSLLAFFLAMATAWQAAIMVILVFLLSNVLRSLEGFILRIATGEAWGSSLLIGRIATEIQRNRRKCYFEAFKGENKDPHEKMDEQQLQWEFFNRFPVEEGYLAPTSLGNIIAAAQSYLWQRYRIDMSSLLPILNSSLDDTDQFKIKIESHKSNMTFLLNMGFVLLLFAVEYMLFDLFWDDFQWKSFLVPGLLAIIAYLLMYRSAVAQAQSWGQAVKNAFIVNQDCVLQKFGLEEGLSSKKKREAYYKIGQWLAWAHRDKYECYFKEQYKESDEKKDKGKAKKVKGKKIHGLLPGETEKLIPYDRSWPEGDRFISYTPSLSCTSSANVTANVRGTISSTYDNKGKLAIGGKIAEYLLTLDYKFPQEGQKVMPNADGAYVIVSDPQMPGCKSGTLIPTDFKFISKPAGKCILRESGNGWDHFWIIEELAVNAAGNFEYQVEDEIFRIEILDVNRSRCLQIEHNSQPFDQERQIYKISIKNACKEPKDLKLQITDKRFSAYKKEHVVCSYTAEGNVVMEKYCRSEETLHENQLIWSFPSKCVPSEETLDLNFVLKK